MNSTRWTTILVLGTIVLTSRPGVTEEQKQIQEQDVSACEAASENVDTSIEACTRLLEREIRDSAQRRAVALTFRALAWRAKDDLNRAVADFTEAIGLAPDFAPAYEARGDLLRDNDQCDLALADYDQAIKLAPERVPVYLSRSECLVATGKAERAVADLDQVIKVDTGEFALVAWRMKARLNIAQGNLDHAIADFDAAIKLDPKRADLYIDRGMVRSGKGEDERARTDFEEAIKLDPNNAAGFAALAWNMKGRLHAGKGDLDRAIADFDQAIRLDPKRAAFYFDRSAAWSSKGDHQRALADSGEVIKLEPDNPAGYSTRGNVHRALGEYARAIADYDQALARAKDDLTVYGNRGLARFYLGDFAKAAEDFKRVLDGQPNAYSALYLYLSRARSGKRDAGAELTRAAGKLKPGEWPYPMVELYLGRKPLPAAEAAATKPEERCEAQFYIGMWQIVRGASAAAQKALQTAADICPKDFVEHVGAVAELKRLKEQR